MKVLLFTHIVDIDGMGSAVLSKLAFEKVEVIYCDTFEINEKLTQKINDNSIYAFDKIFITDICPFEDLIVKLENDNALKDKVQILDHHISILESMKTTHKIAKIEVENNFHKCSGTSLFYEYLKENTLIAPNSAIDEFVELTRQYDTWEWKTKYNNELANNLNIMFSILGKDSYVDTYYRKLRSNLEIFDTHDNEKIAEFKAEQKRICEQYISTIHMETVNGFNAAVINDMQDEYKNDVAEMLKANNFKNADFIAMKITKRNTLSFRSIKPDINVGKVAESFGGKGHKPASSCTITNEVVNAFKLN